MAATLPPLVLMHGVAMSGDAWRETVPLLAVHHNVFTPTALGHRGGPPVQRRPARIWGAHDALLPLETYGRRNAREMLPQARFEVLPDVGHAPMFDDPELVARTILEVTAAGDGPPS